MNISATIEFKSTGKNYTVEKSGLKSNTVRVIDFEELLYLESILDKIHYIKISLQNDKSEYFKRELTDITEFSMAELKPKSIYIFSWGKL